MAASSSAVDPNTQRKHHKEIEEYEERPKYRKGRRDKAVKVYTVNMESRYLLVMNVPALGVTKSLLEQMALYGEIEEYRVLFEYPCEEFTEVYWVKYRALDAARTARRKMDGRPFFSNCLHMCYAPEFEGVEETREKLEQRRQVLARRTKYLSSKHTSAAKPAVSCSSANHSGTVSDTGEGSAASHQCTGSVSVGIHLDTPTGSLTPQTLSLPPLPAPPGIAPPPPHPPSSDQVPYPSMVPTGMTTPQRTATNTPARPTCVGLSLEERLSLHQAWVGGPKVHNTHKKEAAKVSVRSVPPGTCRQEGGAGQEDGSKQEGEAGQGGGAGHAYFSYYSPPAPEDEAEQQTQKCQIDQSLIGSPSVERSVLRVRQHMRKVLQPSAKLAPGAGPPKKRKRI